MTVQEQDEELIPLIEGAILDAAAQVGEIAMFAFFRDYRTYIMDEHHETYDNIES